MDTVTFRATTTQQLPLLSKISDTIIFIVGVAAVITFLGILACATRLCFRFLRRHPRVCCSSGEEPPYSRYDNSALARAIAANKAALIAAAEEGMALKLESKKRMTSQKCGVSSLSLCRNVSTISADVLDSSNEPSRHASVVALNGKLSPLMVGLHPDINGNGQQLNRDKGSESSDMPLLEYKH